MDAVNLCDFCKRINFDALRVPLISDLPALKEGRVDRSRQPFKDKSDEAHKVTTLGCFGDIIRRSKTCRLCQLIGDALTRHAAHRPNNEDICDAEASFFGVYRDSQGEYYWNRRLSIFVDIKGTSSIGSSRKRLFYVFQACDIGAASIQVDEQFVDPRPEIDMMIFGGRVRPLLLDIRWVQRWVDICKRDHGIACERSDLNAKHSLKRVRFVDVEQMCVTTLEDVSPSEQEFVALSYVWGGPQKLRLQTDNKEELAKPGALAAMSLPETIADSILLVKSLGFRSLWIDSLCIIQDDNADKAVQIAAMSQIYGFAFLTIMAASAPSANGGLPGLRPGSRSSVQQELVVVPAGKKSTNGGRDPGLSLMTTLQPLTSPKEHYLEHTPWNGRGWTMQERVLSRRVLVFMPEQVYWVCQEATFCEESYLENDSLRFSRFHEGATELTLRRSFRNFYEPDDDEVRFWKIYQNLVASYTRRTFTYQGDVFDGCLAILQGLSALSGDDFAWGLPRSHFEQGLLWTSFTGLCRRQELSTLPMTSLQINVPFPSWSWMGWIGEAFICIGDDRCDADIGESPEILCFAHFHAPLRIERIRRRTTSYDQRWELPGWKPSHNKIVTLEDVEAEHSYLYSGRLDNIPELQIIFFWTSSALFNLVPPAKSGQRQSTIVDSTGAVVGSTGIMMSPDLESDGICAGQHEFIVLGSRRNPFTHPVLLVLQIKWEGAFAQRVNSGEINEEAWKKTAHTWKLIPLR